MLSHSVPWQMKNNNEFHKDLAVGRNEKKELCMCRLVQDFSSPWLLCLVCQRYRGQGSATGQLLQKGVTGSCLVLLLCCVCVCVCDFCLNFKSENEKRVNNIHNPTP